MPLTQLEPDSVCLMCLWEELKGLGADFVFGFVQSMDGERDPRNLLLAFQAAKNIIRQGYDLGKSGRVLVNIYQTIPRLHFAPWTHRPLSFRQIHRGAVRSDFVLLPHRLHTRESVLSCCLRETRFSGEAQQTVCHHRLPATSEDLRIAALETGLPHFSMQN